MGWVKLVSAQPGILRFEVIGAGAISVILRIEEELLCKTKSSRESAVLAPPCFLAKARTGVTQVQVPGGHVFLQFN